MPGTIESCMGDFLYGDFSDTLGIDNYYLKNLVSRQRGKFSLYIYVYIIL